MKPSFLIAVVLAKGLAYGSSPRPADVVVLVRGEPAVPGTVDQDARARVSWIYNRVGVRIAWRESPGPVLEGQVLIELHYAKVAPAGISAGALAYARPFDDSAPAIFALYDRVRFVAGRSSRETALLAYVLAHEIGHILERTNAHTSEGIMKAHWSGQDYDGMERGSLRFTPVDFDQIRLGLASLKLPVPESTATVKPIRLKKQAAVYNALIKQRLHFSVHNLQW